VSLTFDRDLPALGPSFGMTFADPNQRGTGSSIENNVVEKVVFGRGIWISGAVGVTVQGNEVGPTSNGGIVVAQDTKAFPGPPAHDITIRGNKVAGSLGPMASGAGSHIAVGAIMVVSKNNTAELPSSAPNTNIVVEGNSVRDSGRAGLWVGELSGGSVRDNCILRWNQHPELPVFGVNPQLRAQLVQDFSQAVVIRNSRRVQNINNSNKPTGACAVR